MRKEVDGVYNWNKHQGLKKSVRDPRPNIEIDDETLRDGMQGTHSDHHPNVDAKYEYLKTASEFGFIDHADIGIPINGESHRNEMIEIINFARTDGLKTTFSAAGRGAKIDDIRAILEITEKTGEALEADLFLDVSKLRHKKEGWDRDVMVKNLLTFISVAKSNGLPVMFVPERASVTPPEELDEVLKMVADLGVDRIGIADTTGVLMPKGTENILRHVFEKTGKQYPEIKWDFHAHNDLGVGTANCVVAASEGIDRIHATGRGIGERVGNVELEQLVVILNLEGYRNQNTEQMQKFAQLASDILTVPILSHEPIVGPNWPETASGIHASTMMKDLSLYLPFDPAEVGLKAHIKIGPMSGLSNVYAFCDENGIRDVTEERALEILNHAKFSGGLLTYEQVKNILGRNGYDSK